jgi:Reverse transcriptase (RNA-dependent DNA polymerase).
MRSGLFLDKWKTALVVPIFKSGEKNNIQNYRPISIISIIQKIYEKLTYDKIKNILNPLIIDNQFGFMKHRSTLTNLVSFSQFIAESLERRCQADCI